MKNKLMSAKEAAKHIRDGDHVMVGGFLDGGNPQLVIREVIENGTKELTITSNDTGKEGCSVYDLMFTGNVVEVNASYIGSNPETGRRMITGETKVNLFPQGSLAEKIRAGGTGLGGVLTPVGIGTVVEEGKQKLEIGGREYLLELPLHANVAVLKAHVADEAGNLVINGSSRNFNISMAFAADFVIAETESYVKAGEIDPNHVNVPGLLVDAIVMEDK